MPKSGRGARTGRAFRRGLRAKWGGEAARGGRPPAWHTVCHTGGEKLVTQRRGTATRSPAEGRGGGGRPPRAPSIVQVGIRRERRRPFISRRGGRGGAISCHPRSLPDCCCCSCFERPLRRANVAPKEQRMVHGGVAAAAVLGVLAMVTGCFSFLEFLCPPPVDPWWRGAGASRYQLGSSVRTPSAAPHSPPRSNQGGVDWRSDTRMRSPCCYSVTSFSPVEIASFRAACHRALRAGRAEFRAGGGGGGGEGRRRCCRR